MLMMAILLLTMSISGCGSSQDTTPEVDAAFIANPDRTLFYGETLTVVVSSPTMTRPLATQYMAKNPGVTVEIFSFSDIANGRNELGVQLMAGSAPVLIEGSFVDHHDPRTAHFFVDWLPIMNADPNFNEDDWFMNVFHASAVNGQLYAFPTTFAYETVTANSTIPGLSEILTAKDSITLSALIDIHRETPTDNPLLLDYNFDTGWVVNFYLDSFMDIETGWVEFNNEQFINLITYAREVTSLKSEFGEWVGLVVTFPEQEVYKSERYFFQISPSVVYQYFMDFETGPLFTELTPLVNERGELLVNLWGSYVLNANATSVEQALAWDFIQFMMDTDTRREFIEMQPTNRNLFHLGGEWHVAFRIGHLREFGWPLNSTTSETVEDVIAQQIAHMEMPMGIIRALPFAIENIIDEALERFHNGLVSAEQTAADLQNRVTLVLMEMGIN